MVCESQAAQSMMGRFIPHVLISGKEIVVGVRAFLDRSGHRSQAYVTLAAFAGPDITWREFEDGWDKTLKLGFRPVPYFHLVEALGCRYKTPFSRALGWKREHAWELLGKLLVYISQFSGGRLTMHSCVIDMSAWNALAEAGRSLPSDVELCNRYVSEYIVGRFAQRVLQESNNQPVISLGAGELLNFVFDRNEEFYLPFRNFINDQKALAERSRKNSIWQFVDGVGEADMHRTPGIQAADILAWATNRENIAVEGEEGKHIAHILRQVVMSTRKEYDRITLEREFGALRAQHEK